MPKSVIQATALLLASIGAGIPLSGDAIRGPHVVQVAYIGTRAAKDDVRYAELRIAYERLGAVANSRVRFQHHHIGVADETQMTRQVVAVMAAAPAVVIAPTGWLAAATSALANRATTVIFSTHVDPVTNGIVGSMRSSGRPVTGVSLDDVLHDKRIELLRDSSPSIRHVGVLCERGWQRSGGDRFFTALSQRMNLKITMHYAEDADDIDPVVRTAVQAGVDAWYVPYSYLAYLAEAKLIARINETGHPAIYASSGSVSSGAPMSYWQDDSFAQDAMARLTWRVVQGEDGATIPIERPKRAVLEVRGDANAFGNRVDPSLMRRADRIVF